MTFTVPGLVSPAVPGSATSTLIGSNQIFQTAYSAGGSFNSISAVDPFFLRAQRSLTLTQTLTIPLIWNTALATSTAGRQINQLSNWGMLATMGTMNPS